MSHDIVQKNNRIKNQSHILSFVRFLHQTTLINALTLDALYGKPTGKITLNGVPLTNQIFKA